MTPDEWRQTVGKALEARRIKEGYSSRYQVADGVDISESWVRQMESGEVRRNDGTIATPNPRGNKVRILMERLRWPVDAVDQLLSGVTPEEMLTVDYRDGRVLSVTNPGIVVGASTSDGSAEATVLPPEFRAAALELQQVSGAITHMLRAAMEALKAKDHDTALALLQPASSTMQEVNGISERLVGMDPSLSEDVETTLTGLVESMGEVVAVLQASRDEMAAQIAADTAELAELTAGMTDEEKLEFAADSEDLGDDLALAADADDLGPGSEPGPGMTRPSPPEQPGEFE